MLLLRRTFSLWIASSAISAVHGFVVPHQQSAVVTPSRVATSIPTIAASKTTSTSLHVLPVVTEAATTATTTSMDPLMNFFLQTVISNGVPALFTILVIGFTAFQFRGKKGDNNDEYNQSLSSNSASNPLSQLYDDLYGDQEQDNKLKNNMFRGFGPPSKPLPKNTGIPKEQYFKITHLNQKYDSFSYSFNAATQSKASAAAQYRASALERAFGKALPPSTIQSLQTLEQDYLKKARKVQQNQQQLSQLILQQTMDQELKDQMGMDKVYQLDPAAPVNSTATAMASKNATTTTKMSGTTKELQNRYFALQKELQQMELDLVQKVVSKLGPEHAPLVRTAVLGSNTERPLTQLLLAGGAASDDDSDVATTPKNKGKVYVTDFPGDPSASQVAELRQVVTGIVQNANKGDEVVVQLQTGGGTVTGYGLAAAQLMRLKNAGLKLTIAVEQVAASGGYMMACIADKIVASPFAVLGSIGVISDIPNVYERLKQEGIEFQTVTAGKYKRTITPTKKVTKEDFQKSKQDVEEILVLFRDFVAQNRPQLDIESVATGETWFGTAALEKKLCDEIKTVDEILTDYVADGYDVYEIAYKPPVAESPLGKLLPVGAEASSPIEWLVSQVASAVKKELNINLQQPVQERYRVQDDSSDRIRAQD